jgi:hypothetical protein
LGLYVPKRRETNIYVSSCRKAAAEAAASSKPIKPLGGYSTISPDLTTLINDVTIHESGHFAHDILHPTYAARMRALKIGAAATILSPVALLVDVIQQGPYHEVAPLGIGALALVIAAGGLAHLRFNPLENPAFRFEEQFAGRRIVNFTPQM